MFCVSLVSVDAVQAEIANSIMPLQANEIDWFYVYTN